MNRRVVRDATRMAAVLLLGFLTLAPAAQAEDWKWKWSNGFKLDSEDSSFKLKFGGRIMADYLFASGDDGLSGIEDGFNFRRARFFFSGTLYDRITFKAQYDFAGGDADFNDVYIGIKQDWGEVRFGHFREHYSLEAQTSSKYIPFLERALPILAFDPGRNSGVGVHGKSGDKFNWGVGVYYDADSFGVSTGEDNINITGRVAFRPLYEDKGKRLVHVGFSATQRDREDGATLRFRARPEARNAPRFIDTGSFAADSVTILDLELAGVFGPFWFQTEFLQADVDASGSGDPEFSGFYVQAGYYLTGEHRRYKTSSGAFDRQKPKSNFGQDGGKGAWEIAFRYSTLDLNDGVIAGGEQDDISVGLNWYLNPATRLMINYVRADVEELGEADLLGVAWRIDF